MSGYAIAEALGNLHNKRPEAVRTALDLLDTVHHVEEPLRALLDELRQMVPDPKDPPILAGAVWAGADMLITGNSKDFDGLYNKEVKGCTVVKPRTALELLLNESGG